MTTITVPVDPWVKALEKFNQGDTAAGMAVLALGLDGMSKQAATTEVSRRLFRCAQAAATFAEEWAWLSENVQARVELLLRTSTAAWVPCPDCEHEVFCLIHNEHVTACPCPPLDEWDVDPYTEGRPEHLTATSILGARP